MLKNTYGIINFIQFHVRCFLICCCLLPEAQARAAPPTIPTRKRASTPKTLSKNDKEQLLTLLKQTRTGECKIPDGKNSEFIFY